MLPVTCSEQGSWPLNLAVCWRAPQGAGLMQVVSSWFVAHCQTHLTMTLNLTLGWSPAACCPMRRVVDGIMNIKKAQVNCTHKLSKPVPELKFQIFLLWVAASEYKGQLLHLMTDIWKCGALPYLLCVFYVLYFMQHVWEAQWQNVTVQFPRNFVKLTDTKTLPWYNMQHESRKPFQSFTLPTSLLLSDAKVGACPVSPDFHNSAFWQYPQVNLGNMCHSYPTVGSLPLGTGIKIHL